MTTLPIRAPMVPPIYGLARILSFFAIVSESFAEARQLAVEAHKRYPFAEW